MAIFGLMELADIVIMIFATAYIFLHEKNIEQYKALVISIGPAVVLHEIMHKLIAIFLGYNAVIHAAYGWLVIGILLKLIKFPFVFFVPGYASIQGALDPFSSATISLAGPLTNLLLYFISAYLYNNVKRFGLLKYDAILLLSKRINGFLFIFNLLPIPGSDGSHVLEALLR